MKIPHPLGHECQLSERNLYKAPGSFFYVYEAVFGSIFYRFLFISSWIQIYYLLLKNVDQNEENTQSRRRCVVEDVGEGFSVKGVVGTGLTSGRGRWGEGGGPTDWAAAAEYFQLILSVSIMALLAVRCGQQQVHLTQQLPRPRLLALASTRSNQELDQDEYEPLRNSFADVNVRDATNDSIWMANSMVTLANSKTSYSLLTDEMGIVRIPLKETGNYTLLAQRDDYIAERMNVVIECETHDGCVKLLTISLLPLEQVSEIFFS